MKSIDFTKMSNVSGGGCTKDTAAQGLIVGLCIGSLWNPLLGVACTGYGVYCFFAD